MSRPLIELESTIADLSSVQARQLLRGLPPASGYRVLVKPLRYRKHPHLAAWTDFDAREITLQVPEPFLPFGEVIYYAARRRPEKGMRFLWLSEGITFRSRREVLRYLYCHEWMHWYLKEQLERKSGAETACDRFALLNFRRRVVRVEDAEFALRQRGEPIYR